ncbi:acetyl-CoA synthetase-like protein [Trichoderma citrinoviride]|uniref:Acetyl-CoA synthetase-like protein n=1 Tax=Trichoderma citrinoviride TaxID=58853 RepID=A0A2T4B9U0_9HYPO|nr:acetyl-CoA synthetase-like protein [Trichoderma citrinoviride]PTB66087.1 acetyl-CoA synthetase-like protein [Trichoderma citrinoviride]
MPHLDGSANIIADERPVPVDSGGASASQQDLDQIWSWNASIPPPIQGCVHHLIADVAQSQPDAPAVCGWDGDFTYSQLHILANEVAQRILQSGIEPKSRIPILFPKSKWTCVAMLGVINAGCSAIALDGTQPDTRLRSIVHQSQPRIIIASATFASRASLLANVQVLQLDDDLLDVLVLPREEESPALPAVSPSDTVYISFTSGTTGQPKGACISHSNVRSTVHYQGKELGFHRGSRVYDFAPYSFDVAWSNFLHTLCAGGCLCVAAEQDMVNDLSSSIANFSATLINITPTILRTISTIPPTLETVLLSGEMPYRQNVTDWAGRVRLLNTYGPTECTFKCAFSVLSKDLKSRPDIGVGVGFSTWVVHPDDSNCLVSVGSVGELYLEGPMVGQGYLSDQAKTAAAFISDPTWLAAGSNKHPGRRGRLYKTGDLVKYRSDGKLLFVGRKDASQLKIRGQRVEIGDVEHHVRACLDDSPPIIVDVIQPRRSETSTLVLFVLTKDTDAGQVKQRLDVLADGLRDVLPAFMIPSVYLPIDDIPVASTGKVDRRALRQMGSSLSWNEIVAWQSRLLSTGDYSKPSTDREKQLSRIWADVLNLDAGLISTTDRFLRLGGDSVAAMRVVAKARESGFSLTVADIFTGSTLGDLAQMTLNRPITVGIDIIKPFSMLTGARSATDICEEIADLCGIDTTQIEDVFPCTPLQEGLLAMTNKVDSTMSMDYVSRTAFDLPKTINIGQLQKAWGSTVTCTPILRTRIVDVSGEGLVQVIVTDKNTQLRQFRDIDNFMGVAETMGLGAPLCRAGLIKGEPFRLVLEMHHAIFDGWCIALILNSLEAYYQQGGKRVQPLEPFQPFIKHVLSSNCQEASDFWRSQFSNLDATIFPAPGYVPEEKLDISHRVTRLQWPRTGITPSSIIHSALVLLLASYTNSNDVKYGVTVSGRQAPVPGIERIAGPTIATIPVRTKFQWDYTAENLLQQIQQHAVELSVYEQFGLQRIHRAQGENEDASQFQVLLVIQPATRETGEEKDGLFSQPKSIIVRPNMEVSMTSFSLVAKDGQDESLGGYNSYALLIICHLDGSGVTLKMNYDSGAIKETQAHHFAHQFEHLLRQLCTEQPAKITLRDISASSERDVQQLWEWNTTSSEPSDELVTDMIDQQILCRPNATAISAGDRQFTYRQLESTSNRLASRLQAEGVSPGSIVVLSFEKSPWMVVCMISALKMGAIVLPMSAPLSSNRAQAVVDKLQPAIAIVADSSDASRFQGLIPALLLTELTETGDEEWHRVLLPRESRPSDPALILFTSGSTGTPKPILWSHRTLSTNIQAAINSFNITASSRVFQFAGYEFDVSTVESLATLAVGGCLCVPSESDRTNRLAGAINDARSNWLCLTPSVSESLGPDEVPLLKTLVFAGEKLQRKAAFRWAQKLDSVYNWYGPAEASVATSYLVDEKTWKNGIVGTSKFGITWLVDPKNPNILAAIGTIAELCIEGPILASYAGKDGLRLNEEAFLSPVWLCRDTHESTPVRGRLYRTGDLVKYDADGSILFLNRKQDSQRKIRGQRIDLNEVEMCAQTFLSVRRDVAVVAEIISPSDSGNDTLALFISPTGSLDQMGDVANFIKQVVPADQLEAEMANHLPSFMIPRVYIPIDQIPMNHSGKADRQRLRLFGSSLTHEEIASMQPFRRETRKPSGAMETKLQQFWCQIIGIDRDAIVANDNFFRLGGDSIGAMRLVATARKQGLLLTVADVFEAPQLEKMALRITSDSTSPEEELRPFSLLGNGIGEAESLSYAATLCSVPEAKVVDIYPCTSLQQGLLALGAKKPGQYISRSVLGLQADVDADRLQRAWLATVRKLPILRTRIVDFPDQGLVQVVLEDSSMRSGPDVDSYVRNDELEPMGLGTELCRAAIIDRNFILTIHHCTYDGYSLKVILDEIESQYLGEPGLTVTPFQNFIHHISQISSQQAASFWEGQLANLEPRQFPSLPSSDYQPQANDHLERSISLEWPRTGTTPSTILRSSWALLAAQYTSSADVMFGLTVSGRQASLRGIEHCVGPTISTVPIAISIDWDETVASFHERLQRQMIEITPYEQFGLQNIQQLRNRLESSFLQTLLVVQPVAEGKSLHEDSLLTQGTDPFNTYALMIICELVADGVHLRISFDNNILSKRQMDRMTSQFETVLRQMCSEDMIAAKLDAIQTASSEDLDFFWSQNLELPAKTSTCVHEMISQAAGEYPDKIVIDAWDGRFSHRELDDLSTALCRKLMQCGVAKGSVIALFFEKSKWVAVAQLAVLKAGAVSMLQSVNVPDRRLATVFEVAKVQLAVVSPSLVDIISRHVRCFTTEKLLATPDSSIPMRLPAVQTSDPAAILVSSGSTGEPKQILWSHEALAGNVRAHSKHLSIDASSRIFQFASYDFDVGTIEVMSALASSGCVCIPSESQRLDSLPATISSFKVNHINVTPSAARLLRPEDVPCLSSLVFAGENLTRQDTEKWKGKSQRIINWYGPVECSAAAFCAVDDETWKSGVIARINSNNPSFCWLVDPRNCNRLVPFGAVGEIALEGPVCADGYLGNRTRTELSFCRDPGFMKLGRRTEYPGRSGRIYRTGDLAKYDDNGDLIFMGRKDYQLKIRGQLVAPQEVEQSIRRCISDKDNVQIVVDAVVPKHSGNLTLVAFVDAPTQDEMERLVAGLNDKLKAVLPAYAIPSYYIPVTAMPTTQTGKRDRTRLLQIGAEFNPPRAESASTWKEPTTAAELRLRELWSLVLGIDARKISANDSFLRYGDSIQAMRLVGLASQQNLLLTVAGIFQHPVLSHMAKHLPTEDQDYHKNITAPYTLLAKTSALEFLRGQAALLCHIAKEDVEDLFPCTPLQEGLLALTTKCKGDYTGRNVWKLKPSIDIARFKRAWERVVLTLPVLRTRIVDLPGQGLLQVIVRETQCWTDAYSIEEYLREEEQLPMGLGLPLMRCVLIPSRQESISLSVDSYFALTMHHSIYDGHAAPLILEALEHFYQGEGSFIHRPFQVFVEYIGARDKNAEASFWSDQFKDLEASQFPVLPFPTYQPRTTSVLSHAIQEVSWRSDDITPSTVVRTAFALLCSQYSNSTDVVFGTVVDGRKAPVKGIERLAGPTIATVPIRAKVDGGSIIELLEAVQRQAIEMIPYEQTGLSAIRLISEEAQQACQFQSFLVIQPQEQTSRGSALFVSTRGHDDLEMGNHRYHGFVSYALSLIATLAEDELQLEFCFDSAAIEVETVQRMATSFQQLLKKLCSHSMDAAPAGEVMIATDQDLNEIWEWNADRPEIIPACVHHLIEEIAQAQPGATAVSAWDGELSYELLDRLANAVAYRLIEMGVERNMIVPVCFEKSKFAIIAFLGVIQAGGAVLLLDPTLPGSRLDAMMKQVNPKLVVTSALQSKLGASFGVETLIVGGSSSFIQDAMTEKAAKQLPYVSPADLLYAIFTSGSTGMPKGCLMQHMNFSSAVLHQRSVLRLGNSSRMYDFSSYAFDASYWSAFHVLTAGGTLCIPSDEERKNDLTGSIRKFCATDIFLTPSTARLIDSSQAPTLRNVHLGGEEVTKDDVLRWLPYANVFVSYGPAECSAGTLYYSVPDPMPSRLSIGKPVGVVAWIVDPECSERLSPIGTVGELYLEGALVGKGYLGDQEKAKGAFIEDPEWLRNGSPSGAIPGRRGRLYKTGDLVRYDPTDGSFIFVGRKDTQVKLRGQRIELTEVEHHIRDCLPTSLGVQTAVAEVVTPKATGRTALVAFLQMGPTEEEINIRDTLDDLEYDLRQRLPAYMVPTAFIPLEYIPLSSSGKTDRKKLRVLGSKLTLDHFAWPGESASSGDSQLTESESCLQELWMAVLGVSAEKIRKSSSFLRLGGDSISAMRLVAMARTQGFNLTVRNILEAARLSEMAKLMTSTESANPGGYDKTLEPFSLLKRPDQKDQTIERIGKQCGIDGSQIEDVFPCTGVQKSLLSMTAKSETSYVARFSLRLRDDVDIERLQLAWKSVSETSAPILRYRIVDAPQEGLVQVQVREPMEWHTYESVETYLQHDQRHSMGLGKRLTRLAVVQGPRVEGRFCLITQHHAIYDGYSLNLLLSEVSKAYAGKINDDPVAPFQQFIQHIMEVDDEEAKRFWSDQFSELEAIPFPTLPHQTYRPKADCTVRRHIKDIEWQKGEATASTIIRAAWSILTARYTDSNDVIFGAMVTGRQAPLVGLDRMIAPLINAVPVRVKIEPNDTVDRLLQRVQSHAITTIAFEQTELLHIRRINADTERASRFNTLLVVQPPSETDYANEGDGLFQHKPEVVSTHDGLDDFNPNAVMVMCQLTQSDGLKLEISFDSKVMDAPQMDRIARQLEHVLRQICASSTRKVDDIDVLSPQDLRELWAWNGSVPAAVQDCVHDLIGRTMKRQPQAPAICSWDGHLSYAELDNMSHRLASHLISLGVTPGSIIPLCFEKSMWYPVAALGAMRAGATAIAMDSTQPESRLRSIVQQVSPALILCSMSNEALASRLSDAAVVAVDGSRIPADASYMLPKVHPSDILYVVFTSGSTGVPKGILTTHENFASAAIHQRDILHIRTGTRVFDFVSYSFDVSWSNHLQTLICGGCLCIPSEWERKNDISGALNRMECDYVYFTPSVARALAPSSMPGIRTLAMGGEPIQASEVARWTQADTILGIYGPAECAQALSFALLDSKTRNNYVGHAFGARTWLVQPGQPDRLAAIGTVGELMIEGPTVSKGYFHDTNKTKAAYIQDPAWLLRGGRHGTLYKTGDLLRYNSDGSMDFVGRKDGLIKLRGQRIELAEVEYHVRCCLDPGLCDGIAAEILVPRNSLNPILAVFFSLRRDDPSESEDDLHMVPGAYIHVENIPMTTTNKTDRRALRELGSKRTLEQLARSQSRGKTSHMPSTVMEKKLQALWSSVLEINAESITADSSFLHIGGESIAAMRLVSAAREQNLSLTVADIFKAPRLSELALLVDEVVTDELPESAPPFAFIKTDSSHAFIEKYVKPVLDVVYKSVKNVLPATDFQQRSIQDALEDPPSRYPHWIFDLPVDIDFVRLERACLELVDYFDILHTVFIQAQGQFWQVLLSGFRPTYDHVDARNEDILTFTNGICEQDLKRPRSLGQSFIRFISVQHSSGKHKLVFRISHAQFDGFSWGLVLQTLSSIYQQQHMPATPSFAEYISLKEAKKKESELYWTSRLRGSKFPAWSSISPAHETYTTDDRLTIKKTIPIPNSQNHGGFTPAVVFHAACAIVLSRQFGQTDLVFGRLVTGRSMLPSRLQNVVGPCMTEVPVRVTLDSNSALTDVASQLHSRFIEDSLHEAAGMVEIIKNCTDWPDNAMDFGWRTSFQQEEQSDFSFLGSRSAISFYERPLLPRSRPEIYATPRGGSLDLEFEGNCKLISKAVIEDILTELEYILQ